MHVVIKVCNKHDQLNKKETCGYFTAGKHEKKGDTNFRYTYLGFWPAHSLT
jgi:hypothetical protein